MEGESSQERVGGGTVASAGGDLGSLSQALEERKNAIKSLQYQLSRKETELRRTTEEYQLMRELKTINQLTLRKAQADSGSADGRLRISDEALAEVISLEDKIKLANKETLALEAEANLVGSQAEGIEHSINEKIENIEVVKHHTGYDRNHVAARGFVNEENRFREHQKILAQLDEKQRTYSVNTTALTQRIELLTAEIDRRKPVDEELAQAQQMLKDRQSALNKLEDEKKSLVRIMQRKDALLRQADKQDDYKSIKQLEGDKRVFHSELSRCAEQLTSNRKSIIAQASRIRQLEAKLAAANAFLRSVFENDDTTSEEDQPQGIARGTSAVSIIQFEGLHTELAISRQTIAERDEQLLQLDAKVEQLERKVHIIQTAMITRTATTSQEELELEKECAVLTHHLDLMKEEFDREYDKLSAEHADLQAKIAAQERSSNM